jgi:hypothetical protein
MRQCGNYVARRVMGMRTALGVYGSCNLRDVDGVGIVLLPAQVAILQPFGRGSVPVRGFVAVLILARRVIVGMWMTVRMRVVAAKPIAVEMGFRVVPFLLRWRN